MNVRTLSRAAAAVAVLSTLAAPVARAEDAPSIVELARADGRFKTLLAAAQAAGLAATLDREGPFTVFAPTDEAFAALPAGTVEALLAEPAKLRHVLLHHVARGARVAAEVTQFDAVRTLADTTLTISARGGAVRIGEARVMIPDLRARNGVIHVIDRVLLPPAAAQAEPRREAPDLVQLARSAGTFGTLLAAAERAGLRETLTGPGPLTVFAPSDAAFAVLPGGALEALLGDPERLRRLLLHHVVPGALKAGQVAGARSLTTAAGTALAVDAREGVSVGGARVLTADLEARNGVIHVIDRVLLPPPAPAAGARDTRTSARFPRLEATNLEGRPFELPGGLDGELNLCLIAFRQWQQREVDTWLKALEGSRASAVPGFAWWELPTGPRMGEARERLVDAGMRAGIPERAARARTITLWTDKPAFMRALELPGDRTIQVVLIDREGRVLWRTEGVFTPEKGAALEQALGLPGA
ncbi:MAG: fasciclin domain-containing protein [Planctomycetes bacterium]|nr:fasciclin domain-containing protein [Planctomycetota bacterium]